MGFLASLLYALLMNGLPIAEAIVNDRSPAVILVLYWFETVAMLVTGAIRIVLHRRATQLTGHYAPMHVTSKHETTAADVRRALAQENAYLSGFLGFTTVFTIVHGIFVALLVFLFKVAGPLSLSDLRIAFAWAVGVQAAFLLWDMPRIAQWTFAQLQQRVGEVGPRVLITQLGLIFGFPMMGLFGPWGLVGTLAALRALTDTGLQMLQGLVKRRDLPPALARFLARTGKTTVDALEADFDRMKRDAKEVEVLLERPIGEVRASTAR